MKNKQQPVQGAPDEQVIFMCGGVISQSEFDECPMGNLMKHVMPDKWFKKYEKEKDKKKSHQLFKKYAISMI
jgi:hypothetical protein